MNTSNVFVMLLVCILVKSKTSKLNEFHLADVDAQIDKALENADDDIKDNYAYREVLKTMMLNEDKA